LSRSVVSKLNLCLIVLPDTPVEIFNNVGGIHDLTDFKTVFKFSAAAGFNPLYNGNIAAISQSLPSLGTPLQYRYNYDVLNRLHSMVAYKGLDAATTPGMQLPYLTLKRVSPMMQMVTS
jgi:hypothetical protein